MLTIKLTADQRRQAAPLDSIMDAHPRDTFGTVGQIIWNPDGTAEFRVALVYAKAFRKIADILGRPDSFYRPPASAEPTP